jgi:hypothetical protein
MHTMMGMTVMLTWNCKVAKVLTELTSDELMAGRQHFGFKLSTDANGERVLGGDVN